MIRLARFIAKNPQLFATAIKGYLNQPLTPRMLQIMLQYINRSKMYKLMPWKFNKLGCFTAGFPAEIAASMGFFPGFPEAYAALTATAGCAVPAIECADGLGYGRDICTYMKTSIGACHMEWPQDFGGNPPADAYFSANFVCDTHLKWMENEARIHNKPYFALDYPSVVAGTNESRIEEYVDYVEEQLCDMIRFLEDITGRKFDEAYYLEVVKNSHEICSLFRQVNDYRRRFPANKYFEWVRIFMLPMVTQWNQKDAIRFYSSELKRAQKRYGDKQEIQPGREKYRVLWEGITLWYNVDLYQKVLAEKGARVVIDPYTISFAGRGKPQKTMEGTLRQVARDTLIIPFTLNLDRRIEYFNKMIVDYDLDGIILHENQSCRPSSTGLLDLRDALQKRWGIPVLMMNTDHCDPRAYAEGPMNTRIDGFVELMEDYTKRKKH